MHRFFISDDSFDRDKVTITGEQAYQIRNVLRLKPAEHIIILDNSGSEFEVELELVTKDKATGKILNEQKGKGEPALKITLYQSLLKGDKFELVLQKGVELGVNAFVPYISERSVIRKTNDSKTGRWRKIIQEAAEQTERAVLPVLHPVVSFKDACENVKAPAVLMWEEEKSVGLREVLGSPEFKDTTELGLFIGPEGGFPSSEVETAKQHGIAIASLGHRILRAETAGLAAISAIMYERNEIG